MKRSNNNIRVQEEEDGEDIRGKFWNRMVKIKSEEAEKQKEEIR